MSNNLFKSLCFLFLTVVFVIAKILGISVYSDVGTVCCVVVLIGLTVVFLVKYKKERKDEDE